MATFGCTKPQSVATPNQVETRQVTDDIATAMAIPVKLERVVSLAPSVTEMIFAAGGGERLIGVTTYCNYPDAAKNIQKIGDTITPNIEAIIALNPQVVFVSTASQLEAFRNAMTERKIAVYVTNPTNIEGVIKNLRQFGEMFGTAEKANAVADNLQERIKSLQAKIQGANSVRVFVQISKEPLFTIGKDSFMTETVRASGGESVTSDVPTGYPKLSKETAVALNPAAIILSVSDDNNEANGVFKNSPAVKNGRVFNISADLISRPGPRLVDAMEQIAKDLHPDKFDE